MSAPATPRRGRRQKEKVPFWKRDLGSLRSSADDADEPIDHPEFTPTLPAVNLLPARIPESMAVGRAIRVLAAVAGLVIVAMAALWYVQGSTIEEAGRQLAQAQFENAQLQASAKALAPVVQFRDEMKGQTDLINTTLASEPQATAVTEHLAAAARDVGGVQFNNVTVNYHGIPVAGGDLNPCPRPDPFTTDVTVGCATFMGAATDRDQITAFLEALSADTYFVGPYITVTSAGDDPTIQEGGVSFTGTVGISTEALKTPLTEEQLAALSAPPTPTPAPSPGATP